MNKIIFLTLALILVACTPQVTVTSPPPTQTPIPAPTFTQTPQSSSEFLLLQEKFVESENYFLNANGEIEMQTEEDGVIVINGIKVSREDGAATLTHNEETFIINTSTFEFKDNTFTFKDESGRVWRWNGNELLKSYTQDEISQMTNEEKLEKAPEVGPDGLSRGNVSDVKPNLIKYYNSDNELIQVYDLTRSEFRHAVKAGIIEFKINDQYLEMLSFDTGQEAMDYVASNALLYNGDNENARFKVISTWFKHVANPELFQLTRRLPERQGIGDYTLPLVGENYFPVIINFIQNGLILIFPNQEETAEIIFTFESAENIVKAIKDGSIDINLPTPLN